MDLAASTVTFRDRSLEEALARIRDAGFGAVDVTVIRQYCDHLDPLLVDVNGREERHARETLAASGLTAVSLTSYPANALQRGLNADDWVEAIDAYVRLATALGATALILPPGGPAPAPDRWRGTAEHALPWMREAARRALTAHLRPQIALQSNSLLRTTEQGVAFLRLLQIPGTGLAVDTAHLAAMGEDPVESLRAIGPLLGIVMLRDTDGHNYNLPPGRGRLHFGAILNVLDEVGYAGPLLLAIDDPTLSVEERVAQLRAGAEHLAGARGRKAA